MIELIDLGPNVCLSDTFLGPVLWLCRGTAILGV